MRLATLATLYLLTLLGTAVSAWRGFDYYRTPLLERPRHALHWELKPGGTLGVAYGVGGATLMTAMLGYSARKRLPLLRRTGRLGSWLDFHIWCGVTGPLAVVFHSAFKVGGLIAIAFWSMVAVALSGIFGRFLYAQIPRSAAGTELSLDEATRLERDLADRLRDEIGIDAGASDRLDESPPAAAPRSLIGALLALLAAGGAARRRTRRFVDAHPALPRAAARRLGALVRQRELLRRRLALWRRLHELFHYWHVFHKPFAVLMYLFAAIHVGVAWATGYARLGG
ncbi:MAG: hypothetical protein NDJ75_12250 [Thermoanaerobaculia bacterium]|nr:hypothetical protein [Thermoanaerobaculia bacterium]